MNSQKVSLRSASFEQLEYWHGEYAKKCYGLVENGESTTSPRYLDILNKLNRITHELCKKRTDSFKGNSMHIQLYKKTYGLL